MCCGGCAGPGGRVDHEFVARMGAQFYRDVFEPAVRAARE
jgi:hypothetical protein